MNGPEECDGTDGVGPHEACSQTCELEDLTYCGDGIMQFPNEEGIGGPLNDGYEDCDGTDGVGPFQTCTVECELVDYTYCGDGIWQNPNTWGNGGPSGKGDEECDGTDNVGPHETCESDCTITYLTYCGDGITQLPNEEGTGGPYNDGYEDCDGTDNVGPHEVCESDCTVTDLTYCGDGIAQTPNDELLGGPVNDGFEECDDGNGVPGDGCYDCTLEIPDDCLEADYVFEFEKLLVCGDDCSQTCPTLDMTSIDVPVGARYDVEGRVYRGAPGQCQPHEDFYLEVNGEFGPDTVDDPGACAISVRMDELGDFYFNTGLNDVEMHTAAMCPPDQTAESVRLDKLCLYYVEECGNGIVDAGEQCDENGANTDTPCDPAYDSSCTYCDTTCNEHTLEGPYCGDGIMNGPEECDGTDGVGPYQSCSQTCELVDYTYCGDGVWQNPNTWGDGGPSGKGDEECDGTDNVGPHEVCEEDCTLTHFTYCGDGIMQTPNDEFLGGPFNDGYEDCDGTDGVGPYEVCTDNCVLLSDDLCPLVEVITPEDNDPILWYKDGILVKASVSDPFPSSGIKEVRVGFHDITHTWDDGMFIMAYKGASGFFEYQWDSTKPGLPACGIVQADVFGEDYEGNGARNECGDTNTFGIDNAPPITEKTIGDPKHGDGYYVTTDTLFTLTATDCGTGVDYIHYEIWWDSDDDTFVDTQVREETVHSNQTSFTFEEESIHEIRWYAADLIGNVEQMHYQEHAVDDSEPETTKTVGDPKVECTGGECDYYITQQTEITFECTDPEPHPANDVTVYYRYSINGGDWTEPMVYDGPFTFPEDSEHTIEYWCVDALGNEEEHQFEVDIVDTEPPEIEKVVGEPKHACEPQEECDYYVTQDTPITVTATDPQPHPVNDVELWCEWEWTNDDANGYHEPFLVDGPFTFTEDSEHYLHCWAIDALGNRADFYEFDIVDTEEPEIDKSVGQPNHLCEEGEDCHYYITQDTEITLECVDADPHPVDHTTLYWRLYLDGETPPEFTVEEDSEVRIQNTEDSRHILEYYCEDILGNTNDDDGDPWMEIDIVESQPPEIEKVVGEPKVACEPEDECDYYVTQDTTITVTAVDPDPHPVNHVELWCEWEWTDGQSGGIVGPFLVDGPFTFTEDSEHYLHCWAVDALGNEAHLYEIDIVDSQEPETTKTVGEPKVACEQGEECDYYITQQTEITFECTDPQPHPVDDTTIYYKYKINDGEWLGPFVYEEAFTFTEDSRHTLEFWCEDALGNEEEHQFEVDVVDTQIPVINKTMGEPNHLCEEEVEDCHYYITQDTVITLDCYDEDPHPVDHVTLYWRDYLDGDTPPEFTVETDGYVEIQRKRIHDTSLNTTVKTH
ncbi:hypothetical protein KKE06_06185 [Candidatus Micrarchaeota archaeon]|nr:hypothetical protein [Candidatus Micrarchaeota archaeon]